MDKKSKTMAGIAILALLVLGLGAMTTDAKTADGKACCDDCKTGAKTTCG